MSGWEPPARFRKARFSTRHRVSRPSQANPVRRGLRPPIGGSTSIFLLLTNYNEAHGYKFYYLSNTRNYLITLKYDTKGKHIVIEKDEKGI